jgi:hypothetical protein
LQLPKKKAPQEKGSPRKRLPKKKAPQEKGSLEEAGCQKDEQEAHQRPQGKAHQESGERKEGKEKSEADQDP